MNKFFNYYNGLCVGANSPSVFSFDPYFNAVKKLLIDELKEIVFFIEKLKELDVNMDLYSDKVIEFISVLIVNLDFRRENFFIIVEDLYNNKLKLEEIYKNVCNNSGVDVVELKGKKRNLSSKEEIIKALNEHEKELSENEVNLTINQKNLYEILLNLVFTACNSLVELKTYNCNFVDAKNQVLKLLNSSNFLSVDEQNIIDNIKNFSKCNYEITQKLYEKIIEKYGPVVENEVNLSLKKGKAILVSGNDFGELEKILQTTEHLDINIYTHHKLINAFEYGKFGKYKNLAGHYQKAINNFPLDFATFPGPIFISKNSIPQIDVIRGQIYTSAQYPAFGLGQIKNNDFSPLIEYAMKSTGFEKDITYKPIKIGYNSSEISENIDLIIQKVKNKEILKICIIGLVSNFCKENFYIKEFLANIPNDFFAISFSYNLERNNVWNIHSFFEYSVLYKIIEELKKENMEDKINVFFADCDFETISHIFNLINLNVNNIFIGSCCPNVINPMLIKGLEDLFNIKSLTTAVNDIKKIKKE